MKFPAAILLAAFAIFIRSALADPIIVRSGSHDTFTRLTLRVEEGVKYTIENLPTSILVRVPNLQNGFETASIYERIGRNRLTNFQTSKNTIRFDFSCRCEAKYFQEGASLIVIDIVELSKQQNFDMAVFSNSSFVSSQTDLSFSHLLDVENHTSSSVQQEKKTEGELETNSLLTSPSVPRLDARNADRLTEYFLTANLNPKTSILENHQNKANSISRTARQDTANNIQTTEPNPSDLEDLSRNFAAAINRGILSSQSEYMNRSHEPFHFDFSHKATPSAEAEPKDGASRHFNLASPQSHATLTNNFSVSEETFENISCPPNREFDPTSWSEVGDFSTAIAPRRQNFVNQLDQIEALSAIALAKSYMYFGFGVEALAIFREIDGSAKSIQNLFEISHILHYGVAHDPRNLQQHMLCSPFAALWAMLASRTVPQIEKKTIDSAILAFSTMPEHLVAQIGPTLAQRLVAAGHTAEAESVIRFLEHIMLNPAPETLAAGASLALATGEEDFALAQLRNLARSNTPESQDALVSLIEAQFRLLDVVSSEDIELLRSYVGQNRGSKQRYDIQRALVIGNLTVGDLKTAAIDLVQLRGNSDIYAKTVFDVYEFVSEHSTDFEFLEFFFDIANYRDIVSSPNLALKYAFRLFQLGFFFQSESLLKDSELRSSSPESLLNFARHAAGGGNSGFVEVLLFGMNGPEVFFLRRHAIRSLVNSGERTPIFEAGEVEAAPVDVADGLLTTRMLLQDTATGRDRVRKLIELELTD